LAGQINQENPDFNNLKSLGFGRVKVLFLSLIKAFFGKKAILTNETPGLNQKENNSS